VRRPRIFAPPSQIDTCSTLASFAQFLFEKLTIEMTFLDFYLA